MCVHKGNNYPFLCYDCEGEKIAILTIEQIRLKTMEVGKNGIL